LGGLAAAALMCAGAPAPAFAEEKWEAGPSSAQAHPEGVSAELPEGTVLVAGGNEAFESEGELLSAAGTSFSAAGKMIQRRLWGAAALLANGNVLIAGGDPARIQSTPVPETAEVWSSALGGMFSATEPMHVPRQVFTLTTLPNGEVLAVGGSPDLESGSGSATAELYNPETNSWTATGSMPAGRLGQTATLLPDCRVLVVGDNPTAVTYDYLTGTFTPAGSEGAFQRSYQTATLLANGEVLIAGGVNGEGTPLASASVFNPATDTFTPTANPMATPHTQGFAARLADGRVIVGGGLNAPGKPTTAVEIYDPATNSFSAAAPLPPNPIAVSPEAATLSNGQVIVMAIETGHNSDIYTPSAGGEPVSPPAENCSGLSAVASPEPGPGNSANSSSNSGSSSGTGTVTQTVVPVITPVAHPFTFRSAKPNGAGAITFTVSATAPGRFTATARSGHLTYGRVTVHVSHAGKLSFVISPSKHFRSLLRAGHTVHVTVTIAFTPASGARGSTHVVKVTVHGRRD